MERLRERTASFLFIAGSSHIIFIFGLFFIGSITLLMNMTLSRFGILSLIGVLYWVWVTSKKYFPDKYLSMFIILITSFIALLLLSLYFSGKIYDLSPDGQTYHQEAIDRLANGWNPIWSYEKNDIDARLAYYPKAPWIDEASIYQLTKQIEYSKLFNLTLVFSTCSLAMGLLLSVTRIRTALVFMISLLASLNPVSIIQIPSFYVDGQLASLLTIVLVMTLYCILTKGILPLIVLACSLMLLINVKTPGMVYAGILVFGILLVFYIPGRLNKERLYVICGAVSLSFMTGITIFGFNPYVNNMISHRNIYYPFGAPNWPGTNTSPFEMVEAGMPESWKSYNRFHKFIASLFSESEVAWTSKWKLPFTFKVHELMNFSGSGCRVAGLGPIFSGVIILSGIILILILIFNQTTYAFLSVAGILLLMTSIIINPAAWDTRYVPQLWLLPVICIGLCYYFRPGNILPKMALLVIIALTLNIALISAVRFSAVVKDNEHFKNQLEYIKGLNRPVKVFFSNYYSNRIRFNYLRIPSIETGLEDIETCKEKLMIVNTETVVCLD